MRSRDIILSVFRHAEVCLWLLLSSALSAQTPPSQATSTTSTASVEGDKTQTQQQFSQPIDGRNSASGPAIADADAALHVGLMRGQAGDFAGAIEAFRHALNMQPDFAEAHYNLGLALLANSGSTPSWKDALAEFQAAARKHPDYFEALRMAGVAALEAGDAKEAIRDLKAAIHLKSDSAEAHFNLARALAAEGDASGAAAEYALALKNKTPYPEADSALASLLLEKQERDAAIVHFLAALKANPDLEPAHYGLAKALRAQGKADEASEEMQQAKMLLQQQSDAVMSSHLSNEALDRAKQGDLRAAIELAKKAVWLDPASALANFNLGLLLADAGNMEASIYQLRKAISLAPSRTAFYLDLAKVQEEAEDRKTAIETLERAITKSPDDPAIEARLKGLMASTASMPQHETSAAPFPLGATSDTADDHLAFASWLSEQGDFLGAIGELRRGLTLEPGRSDLRYSLAVAQTQIGQTQNALLVLRTVLQLTPDLVAARVALGSLLYQENNCDSATVEFRRVLQLDPGNKLAGSLLQQCQAGTNH
jgi:protein O-GlcNAc transferase